MGVQTCSEDGSGFSKCECGSSSGNGGGGGSSELCGNGTKEGTEECDDGNMVNGDGCNADCTIGGDDCGNGVPNAGECGPEGTCLKDCGNCGNGVEDMGECGPTGNCPIDCDPCKDAVTFAGLTGSLSGPVWTYGGFTGIQAGDEMCKLIGADHICTHAELRKAEKHILMNGMSELASMPNGTSIWLHREDTDMVMVGGVPTAGGAGARCNDWKYGTNHISDGEHCEWDTVNLNCSYDNDPIFDPNAGGIHVQQGALDCGGVMRNITCCYEACVP